jgi:DNA mismatch repair protein MutL
MLHCAAMPTPREIRMLDPVVANQIAAGEVVERPASVVKELVENALDAGADRVFVGLWDGGRKRIQVSDNGHGMDAAQARLAFARHATSKLRTADDLHAIATFGFRGEALASILAVADVTLTTRRQADAHGVRLRGAGTTQLDEAPAGAQVGTDIVVADLFFNVPARLKFLRTPATELGHVLKFLDALALCRPELHLTLHHNDKRVADYPADRDLHARAYSVLGAETATRLHPLDYADAYAVDGLLSDPGLHHHGPGQLTLLVDGRAVSDRTLQHAVAQAYGTLLDRGRYPVGVVRVRCPAGSVDVNVHPQKTEVRFASSQDVFVAVHRAVRQMLASTPWVVRELPAAIGSGMPPLPGPPGRTRMPHAGVADATQPRSDAFITQRMPDPIAPGVDALPLPVPSRRVAMTAASDASAGHDAASSQRSGHPSLFDAAGPWSSLRYVGQVGRCFLVCDAGDAMVLVDQHAAHERVLFEQFVQAARGGQVPSQQQLVPPVVPLAPAEVAALDEAKSWLEGLGITLEPWGERAVRVRSWPVALNGRAVDAEVRALAASVATGGRGQQTVERIERAAATLACHAALRAGDPVTDADVRELLRLMDGVDLSAYCPHGRPVMMKARLDEVGRWFHRT